MGSLSIYSKMSMVLYLYTTWEKKTPVVLHIYNLKGENVSGFSPYIIKNVNGSLFLYNLGIENSNGYLYIYIYIEPERRKLQ